MKLDNYCILYIVQKIWPNKYKIIYLIKNIIIVHKIFLMIMVINIIITIIIIIIIVVIIIIVTIKGIHYKKWRQFLWILKIVRQMNHTDLN